jgi:hypothetical protein
MTYDWLESTPTSVTPTNSVQPDFSFLQSMQMTANKQYEKGLGEVKNAYAAVFNRPVLGEQASARQQQYAKQAQDQMKDIAAADLSDPKNVLAAENIMAPFHQDRDLLANIAMTAESDTQMQQQESMKNSSDPAVRALWDPRISEDIENGRRQVAEAPLSAQAYAKLEKRQSIPVYNMDAEIDTEYAKLKEQGVNYSIAVGPMTYINHNGINSKEAFKTWYMSKAGDKFEPQLRAFARVDMERNMRDIRRQNPGIPENVVYEKFANETTVRLNSAYKDHIQGLDNSAKGWDDKINAITAGKDPDKYILSPEEQQEIALYTMNRKFSINARDKAKDEYKQVMGSGDPNSIEYQKYQYELANHPTDYLARTYKNQMADKWASGMAEMGAGVKIEANSAWKNMQDVETARRGQQISLYGKELNAQLGYDRLGEKEYEFDVKTGQQILKTGFGSARGYIGAQAKAPGTVDIGSGSISRDVTNAYHVPDPLARFENAQRTLANNIDQTVFDAEKGVLSLFGTAYVGDGGLSPTELAIVGEGQTQALLGVPLTAQQKELTSKLRAVSKEMSGVDNGGLIGPQVLRGKLIDALPAIITQLLSTNDPAKVSKAQEVQNQYTYAKQQRDTYLANERTYNEKLKFYIDNTIKKSTDPEVTKLINPVTNDFYKAKDIEKSLPSIRVVEAGIMNKFDEFKPNDPNIIDIPASKLAEYYINGQVKVPTTGPVTGRDINIGDKAYSIIFVKDNKKKDLEYVPMSAPGTFQTVLPANAYVAERLRLVEEKVGNPKKLKEIKQKAGEKVMEEMGNVGKDGLIGSTVTYAISDDGKSNESITGATMIKDAVLPENRESMYYRTADGEKVPIVGQELVDITNLLTGDMKNIANYATAGVWHGIGPNGNRSVEIKLNPAVKKDGTTISGETPIGKILKHGAITVDISPNAVSPVLRSFPEKHDFFVYGNMLTENKTIESDSIMNSYGFKYQITPRKKGPDGKNTEAVIQIDHQVVDIKTGKIKTKNGEEGGEPIIETEVIVYNLMKGENAVNPDQLYTGITAYAKSWFETRANLLKAAALTVMPGAQQGPTINQFKKSLNN